VKQRPPAKDTQGLDQIAALITVYQCALSRGRAAATPPSERSPCTADAKRPARQLALCTLLATGR